MRLRLKPMKKGAEQKGISCVSLMQHSGVTGSTVTRQRKTKHNPPLNLYYRFLMLIEGERRCVVDAKFKGRFHGVPRDVWNRHLICLRDNIFGEVIGHV
ncbi:hypothetical protein DRO37_05515 [Candidatus Bathyarchaeota archaeon]|nr:MAG: hypothetical protein DRO37_05515 [Candidatus Bathyarchaeota archaeon]